MDSGWCEFCLAVQDIERSLGFHMDLGFKSIKEQDDSNRSVAIFRYESYGPVSNENSVNRNSAGFRNSDAIAIARKPVDRSLIAHIRDEEDGMADVKRDTSV